VNVEWAPGAMERATMIPMGEVTWESMLALPEGTEMLVIFVAPLGVAIKGMQFFLDEHNRATLQQLREAHTMLPAHVSYVLPKFDLPDPEAFASSPRKDADNG
jgi:hypothetical protein